MPGLFTSSPTARRHRSWLLSGGALLILLIGGSAAAWLAQSSQDLRQQAQTAYPTTLNLAAETNAVKITAQTKGISLNDAEAAELSNKIQRVKAGNPRPPSQELATNQESVTASTATPAWEVGLTNFAVEKLRNASYSPFTDTASVLAAYSEAVAAGRPASNPPAAPASSATIFSATALGSQLDNNSNLPRTYDWRSAQGANFMTPVRNQGSCGSCWAFSGNATLETAIGAYFNQPTKQLDLSEQNLLSCSTNPTGCLGTRELTVDYNDYVRTHGVVPESCMAYRQCDQTVASCTCPAGGVCTGGGAVPARYTATYSTVPIAWSDQSRQIVDAYATANNIKRAIIEHGAVSTGIYVYSDFELYVGGVYQRTSTATFEGGHVITLVGWGEENGQPYWLFKNSWSTLWGINGYGKYKMFGARPGDTIDLNYVYTRYRNVGGPDFGIEGLGALYLYGGSPLLTYIDTPQLQGDTITRACTDRDNDSYCFWGFGTTKPANGCPASCASHTQADCDDGRNTLGGNCAAITPAATPTIAPTAARTPTPQPTVRPTTRPTARPSRRPTVTPTRRPTRRPTQVPSPTPVRCGGSARHPVFCPRGQVCYRAPMPTCPPNQVCTQVMPAPVCRPAGPTATLAPTTIPTASPVAPADIDQSGTVDAGDITILLANYGRSPLVNPRADVNRDGAVNALDYVYVLDFYGRTTH